MTTYRLDLAAFEEHLLNAPWVVEEMRQRAERAKDFAVSVAPDAPPYGEGYIASFHVDSGTHGGVKHNRAFATLSNDDDAAVLIEFGYFENRDERGRFKQADQEAPVPFRSAGTFIDGQYILTRAMDVLQA